MTAPSLSTRGTPAGIKLKDGFSTKISFSANLTIEFWEKSVTPPGLDGGDAIEQTTMFNATYRTFAARQLKTMTEVKVKAAYNPKLYTSILALINVETSVTVHFPDGSTLVFYGFLKEFMPGELKEGEQPEADITVVCTNADPTTGAETAAVYTDVVGT